MTYWLRYYVEYMTTFQGIFLSFQLDASLMSCCLCLISVSVFLRVNFLLKAASMAAAAAAHIAVYFVCVSDGRENVYGQRYDVRTEHIFCQEREMHIFKDFFPCHLEGGERRVSERAREREREREREGERERAPRF